VADVPVESIRFTLRILAQSGAQREKFKKSGSVTAWIKQVRRKAKPEEQEDPYNYGATISWRLSTGRDRGMPNARTA
jgi:hypothetical protein